ncbi:MAG: hypothetical protein J1E34_06140 [Oscillospiraceae bacterium]|nr:hypothetical protein [Oscillospiraceae bacterium]
MNKKKFTAILLFAVMIIGISACSKHPADNGSTEPSNEVTDSYNEISTLPAPNEEATLAPLEFNINEAQILGEFETEIYGTLKVFFQQDRLFLLDSYETKRFELYAFSYLPNYEDSPIELIGEDVNFDGYTDFYLLYSKGNLNTYYCFWIWNMQERTYEYYLPLSSVPSPVFNAETKRVISLDQVSLDKAIETEYEWNNEDLVPVATSEKRLEIVDSSDTGGIEEPDSSVTIFDGILLSTVIMKENSSSNCKWTCQIEDERIVRLSANTLDRFSDARTFLFRGISPGTTTVVLRYAEEQNESYIAQRILNITVNSNYTMSIVVVE